MPLGVTLLVTPQRKLFAHYIGPWRTRARLLSATAIAIAMVVPPDANGLDSYYASAQLAVVGMANVDRHEIEVSPRVSN